MDGDDGILRYKAYPIEELAESSSFVEVAYLLMYRNLPIQSQLAGWEFTISQHSTGPQGLLVFAMRTLPVFHADTNEVLKHGLRSRKDKRWQHRRAGADVLMGMYRQRPSEASSPAQRSKVKKTCVSYLGKYRVFLSGLQFEAQSSAKAN
ncbi:hypothetical protein EJB05_21174 [Eragrostis curvula]|uniref:Uncharacterized protein n=1 Tax=Eragrostis curvula TaxID=38414 RepID=A0A5J9V2N7_9POAL|nr:hypothetical protein EJB05_21174 [Eragrostis curvula]